MGEERNEERKKERMFQVKTLHQRRNTDSRLVFYLLSVFFSFFFLSQGFTFLSLLSIFHYFSAFLKDVYFLRMSLYVPCIYRMPGGVIVGVSGLCCCVPVQCVTSIV